MRRFRLTILLGFALAVIPASAFAASHAAFKTGTYKGKIDHENLTITLKRSKCKAPSGGGAATLGLCVALPVAPELECRGATTANSKFTAFATPVRLSASGKAVEQAAITLETIEGEPPSPGTQTLSVSFTKKGTVSGYLEEQVNIRVQDQSLPCTTGRVPFTAKLG